MSQMGWIKLHRSLVSWEWYGSPKHLAVFLDLLLNANHKDNMHRGLLVKKGQLSTSYGAISERSGVSYQSVRTVLVDLVSTKEITHKTSRKCSVITVLKWDQYQVDSIASNSPINRQLTDSQQTTNRQLTTNKNVKNVKNEENERKVLSLPNDLFDNVVNSWNKELAGKESFTFVRGLKSTTREKFFEIIKFNNEFKKTSTWQECFSSIKNIDTYNGNNPRKFVASLVWLIDTEKIVDVLNGQFGGNNETSNKSVLEEFGRIYSKGAV